MGKEKFDERSMGVEMAKGVENLEESAGKGIPELSSLIKQMESQNAELEKQVAQESPIPGMNAEEFQAAKGHEMLKGAGEIKDEEVDALFDNIQK